MKKSIENAHQELVRMADFPLPYSYYPYDMIREVKKENTSVPKNEENSTELCKQWTDKDLSRWVVTPSAFNVHIRHGGLLFLVGSLCLWRLPYRKEG